MARRALVLTVVHHPEDARIRHREIQAMLDAGWQVTYAAPFTGYGLEAASPYHGSGTGALTVLDVPRALGRRRGRALLAARRVLRRHGRDHDVVLLHDPELLAALPGTRGLPPVVWDVHEDTAAAVSLKPWLPVGVRRAASAAFRGVERVAERHVHLLLAENSYAERFRRPHPIVRNTVRVPVSVPAPGTDRVVYLGHLSLARGAAELVHVGAALRRATDGAVSTVVIGHADAAAGELLERAVTAGDVTWTGFVPSAEALPMLDGALAGLALLHDEPNYRASMPTKIVEYMAHGVPVITTPLPLAADVVTESGSGVVVAFNDPDAAVQEILALRENAERRHAMGQAGHRAARTQYDWSSQSAAFLAELARLTDG